VLLHLLVAVLPVLIFLLVLLLMDSFKLLPFRLVLVALGYGVAVALACLALHDAIGPMVTPGVLKRVVAPVTEECAKSAFIIWLLVRRRLGFAVDAAIAGFAVGAGFAVAENLDYLQAMPDARIWVWIVRGLGTAILHGATTAVFAMIARSIWERQPAHRVRAIAVGWPPAIALHAGFNNMLLPPLAATLVLLTVLPIVILMVFRRSEAATHEWITGGLDLDLELLRLVQSEDFVHTRFGGYLRDLKDRIPGPLVADMFCLLRLELELAIQAKAMLMARQAGLHVPPTGDLYASLEELRYLEGSIGRTGLLALEPLQVTSDRDKWHRYLLEHSRSTA
jgi:RsiW-degrading membrane proteinase PrsW (M82 family)